MIRLLLLFFLALLISCKSEQELGDNYYYLPIYEALDVGFPDGAIIYTGTERYLFDDVLIPSHVVAVNHNDEFILAIRIPKDSIETDRYLISETNPRQYYIIDKKYDKVYGPLGKDKYLNLRYKLVIPDELIVKYNREP